jgi:putative ABC transport system permease protein
LLAFRLDALVFGFVGLVTVACAIAFAAYPALRATRGALDHTLRAGARSSRSRHQRTIARGVVIAQVALTLVLVTAASLLSVTLRNLTRVDGGFAADRVLLVSLESRGTTYEERGVGPLHQDVLAHVRGLPGIRSAAMATTLPLFGGTIGSVDVDIPGYEGAPDRQPWAWRHASAPGYFDTMGIALESGRDFTSSDGATAEPVAIVNASFARRYFAKGEALGGSFRAVLRGDSLTALRIVGVAADAKYSDLRSSPEPALYVPMAQTTETWTNLQIVLRTIGDPAAAVPAVRRAIDAAAPGIRVHRVSDMREQLEVATSVQRLAARVAMFASVMVLVLSVVGLYGVVAYGVARRANELGVRMALGARAPAIVWLVTREVVRIVGVGVLVGVPLTFAANRALASQLFGVGAYDPIVFALSVAVIAGAALLAGAIPARRAARIDPCIALAAE